jgi:hypothetical protein
VALECDEKEYPYVNCQTRKIECVDPLASNRNQKTSTYVHRKALLAPRREDTDTNSRATSVFILGSAAGSGFVGVMDFATAPFQCLYGAEYTGATYTQWLKAGPYLFLFEESASTRGSGGVADMGPEQQQGTLMALDRLDRLDRLNDMSAPCRAERQHIFCKKTVEKLRVISMRKESVLGWLYGVDEDFKELKPGESVARLIFAHWVTSLHGIGDV